MKSIRLGVTIVDIHEKLPALRALDVTQVPGPDGQPYLVLNDALRLAERPLAVSIAGYLALAHLDGQHSCAEIQEAYQEQLGAHMPADQILDLVAKLDEALLLEGARFEEALAAHRAAYRAAPGRFSREMDLDAEALRGEIEEMIGSGTATTTTTEPIRGLVAPHLDYPRGYPCYADAYATLAAAPFAERYVILGTSHAGREATLVATTKDFHTPLGNVPTDRAFLHDLEQRLGRSLCANEHEHAAEHSIELQVHILQVLARDRAFEIVPILCPSPCGPVPGPADVAVVEQLQQLGAALDTLVRESPRRTTIIAGADLSHVGQRFGDEEPTTDAFLADVGRRDRELLGLLETRQDAEFLSQLAADGNPTRICSVGCICGLLYAIPNGTFRLLRYHQAVDLEEETHVTCAAGVVVGE